jgi:hypothetical protein
MSLVTAHVERLHDTLETIKRFFPDHYAELALDQGKAPLDPKYPVYLEAEDRGQILHVVLRERGAIIAYFVGFVDTGLHYQQTLTLQMDIFWLHPDYRDGDSLTQVEAEMLGMQLFEEVRAEARRRGVKRWFCGSKMSRDASKLFEALGMVPSDLYYTQWLGD